jgi:hypothetical protein
MKGNFYHHSDQRRIFGLASRRPAASVAVEVKVDYVPTEKQRLFHECPADICLYGGAAGGGKSMALLWEAFAACIETPGTDAMLMRRTYPALEKSLILESIKLFPRSFCEYHEAKRRWTIKPPGATAASHLWFGFCERDVDVYTYQSAQWSFLGIDESTHFTGFQILFLFSRVRSILPNARPRMRLTTNPGNVGHGWHKQFFKIGVVEPYKTWRPKMESINHPSLTPPSRCFIPATVYDNKPLMESDPQYVARLESLPTKAMRDMLLYGKWDVFAGQFFPEFNPDVHVIPAFSIPRHWKIYRSVDFGFNDPFCCLWFAVDEGGRYFCFKETYQSGLRDHEQAQVIKEKSVWLDKGELSPMHVDYTVGDPSMNQRSKDSGISTQENYMKHGVPVIPAPNARVHGWMQVRNMLAIDKSTGKPWLSFFPDCANVATELQEAITHSTNVEDISPDCRDHAIDALRYFVSTRPTPADLLQPKETAIMDKGTVREWTAYRERCAKISGVKGNAIAKGFNEE